MFKEAKKEVELVIIGAGIAGVAAAVYAKRSGLNFLIFEAKAVGGQLLFIEDIDNYIGLELGTKGRDLAEHLTQALSALEITTSNNEIIKIEIVDKHINVYTSDLVYRTKGAILATGASFKKLDIKGEANFLGKGLSYCAVCDGFFFKDKDVAVVGGGNSAVEEALYLSEIASRVTLIHRRDKLRSLDYLQKRLLEKDNIEIIFNSVVKEIKGGDVLKEVVVENIQNKKEQSLLVQGLFIAIGIKPNTEFFSNIVSTDEQGVIITDEQMKTSCDFIWAAGDCRKRPLKQLITAASEGAISAISAYKYLRGQYISS